MLDKLVESKDNKEENKKLRKFLLATSTITISGVIFALIFSLFTQSLAMGGENINLSSLITPAAIPEDNPAPPEPVKKDIKKKTTNKVVKNQIITRKQNMLRLDESPKEVPNKVSTTQNTSKARPNTNFKIARVDSEPPQVSSVSTNARTKNAEITGSFGDGKPTPKVENEKPKIKKTIPKPPPPPKVKKKKKVIVSKGVVNGKASRLVKPTYSAAAKAAQIRGRVTVEVLINENGKVVSAKAVKGHPLLRSNAVSAAKRSMFTPTYLSDEKVKVRGLIIYNFN